MKRNPIIKNIFILSLSGILAKSFDFAFRAYYSRILGSEGMGLLSLGFSMHSVMLTFATAGLGVAVSKVTSEYMERGNQRAVLGCMNCSLLCVSTFSLIVMLITFLSSPYIASEVLGDQRVSVSLCALSPSILFMGISYCLKGFFYASRKTLPPASSEILEQTVKFIAIKTLLKFAAPHGIKYACAAVFLGISIGEFSSCLYLCYFYLRDKRKFAIAALCKNSPDISSRQLVCKLLGVSIPAMITSLCCSSLRMKEEVLIVSSLERGSMSHADAISTLGILHGMVMPLLVMPLSLMGSVMSLLIPEISRAGVSNRQKLCHTAAKIYKTGLPVGIFVSVIFMLFNKELTQLFYGSDSAASLVFMLSPLFPVMVTDSISCAILNGLGKQPRMLLFSLLDFCLRFTLIYFALPHGKTTAFAIMIAASNIFTCFLSYISVARLTSGDSGFFFGKLTKIRKYGILNR